MCCLKRPFDDHAQPRIRVEAEAVLALLGATDRLRFIRAVAHDLGNRQDPVVRRAEMVQSWLDGLGTEDLKNQPVEARIGELLQLGFKSFDAFHLACAEMSGADVFVTTDDRLLATARRSSTSLRVRVTDPGSLVAEVFP